MAETVKIILDSTDELYSIPERRRNRNSLLLEATNGRPAELYFPIKFRLHCTAKGGIRQ